MNFSLPSEYRNLALTGLILLLVILWLVSGLFAEPELDAVREQTPPMTVLVRESQASEITRRLTLQGDVEPSTVIRVRARTAGRIASREVRLGSQVKNDQLLMQIALDDREAKLRRAEAHLKGRQSDYEATRHLAQEGLQARLRVEAAEAELEAAKAERAAIKLDMDNTRIRAPISGILDHVHAQVGDFVAVGEPVADIVENNPLKAVVQVPQQSIHLLNTGMPAWIYFTGEDPHQGEIDYIASRADTTTRTFRVEILLKNPERRLPSGISARVEIPIEDVIAHRVSPALIGLDDQGSLVVRGVNQNNQVVLYPVNIVRAEADSVWISNIPEQVKLITVGQGFVSPGEQVKIDTEQSTEQP